MSWTLALLRLNSLSIFADEETGTVLSRRKAMMIISTPEHSVPDSRFNTLNTSVTFTAPRGRSWWWSCFTDEETEAQGLPAISGGLSSSEAPLLCPPCKAASGFAWPHSFHHFLSDLGAWQARGKELSELPSDSNVGAWSSCPRWEETCGVGSMGYGVRSHGISLGLLGQMPSHLVSLCFLICMRRWD